MPETPDATASAEEFVARVEQELEYEVDYDPGLGDELGWFCLELILVCEGEEFEGDVDFELSEDGVEILYAEITAKLAATERRAILGSIGERLISAQDEETYQYEPSEDELAPLLEELDEIHEDVFDSDGDG